MRIMKMISIKFCMIANHVGITTLSKQDLVPSMTKFVILCYGATNNISISRPLQAIK